MKRLIFLFFFGLCIAHTSKAQVKIGNNPQTIDAASVLELESTDKVLVITRVTTVQMNAISPLQGALVYNTDLQGVHYYDGTQWVNIGGGGGTGGPLTADAIVNAGGDPTIVITPTATGDNLEVAPNSISTAQIAAFGINGTTDIQPESIGVGKLAGDVIGEFELSENSVGPLQIQNQNIDLGDFNNVAGFITAADVVSADAGNVIESRADGVFYDDASLQTAINQNTDAILLDDDQSVGNEIQNLSLAGNTLTLSKPIGADDVITLPTSTGEIDDNELITGAVLTGTNLIITEAGTDFTVPLASLSGGGGGGTTEIADQITITGLGIASDPFTIEPGATGEFLSTDAAGEVVWSAAGPGGGGGATEIADQITITGVGLASDPFTIEPGATGEFLSTDAAGDVVWTAAGPGGGGTTEEVDGVLLTGTGTSTDQFTIAPGGPDQILRTNTAGDAVAWVPLPTGAAAITDTTIDGDGSSAATALSLADAAVTLEKIAPNGATANGDIMQWNTDLDGAGPLTDAGWEVVANTASTTLDDANIFVGDALNAPQGVPLSGDATIDNLGELTIAPEAVELTMLNQNGASADGDIMQWNTDLDGTGPLTEAGWEVAPNAGHTGEVNSIFYADTDGTPTQFFHPDTGRPSFYWDPNGRNFPSNSFGALAIGVDWADINNVPPAISNEVKVHIGEFLSNRVSYSLLLHNAWDTGGATSGSGVGMLFASDRFSDGKGALIFERRDDFGVGDFHFLQNNVGARLAPDLATDKAFTITREKNIRLYGGIDIDGVGAGTGFGAAGQVLSSTGTGVEWAPAGGLPTALTDGQIITWDADATPTAGGYVVTTPQAIVLDVASNEIDISQTIGAVTTVTSSIKLDGITLEAFNNATDDVIRIKPAPGALPLTEDQILFTDRLTGTVSWEDTPDASEVFLNPALDADNDTSTPNETTVQGALAALAAASGGQNFANTNLTLSALRTHNLNGNNLVFTGSGDVAIGTLPGAPQSKLDVDGQIQARNGFAASDGSMGNPAYGFSADPDTGVYRPGVNQLSMATGGNEAVSILANQNVGIGTNSPTETLHVNGNIRTEGVIKNPNGAAGAPSYSFNNTTDSGMYSSGFDILNFSTAGNEAMRIDANQNIGIGINPTEKLHINGNLLVTGTITPDYVFQSYFDGVSTLNPSYKFMSLEEIKLFTRNNKHLPGVPSAMEVKEKGGIIINRATEINLEKIEELFLHTIEQEQKIKSLQSKNDSLEDELNELKKDIKEIKALLKGK